MEPVTIAYIFLGALWVAGAITYLQIMVDLKDTKTRQDILDEINQDPKNK